MFDLSSHAALVTGSARGVGRGVALALAKAGCELVMHGRKRDEAAEEAIAACEAAGAKVHYITADLTDPTDQVVPAVFNAALEACPRLDILVNNAGAFMDLPFLEMTLDRFERTQRLNVTSGYFLTQAFARHWIERNIAGRVIFVGSINGRLAEPHSTAYDTSKGAVEMMVKTLAVALAKHNIRVNGMAPGFVYAQSTSWVKSKPEAEAWLKHHTPNGEIPPAEVCGPAVVYLASDEAIHTVGHMLLVDGGMGAWQHPEPMK